MLDKMLEEYKNFSELQDFARAQHMTIVSQSKKLQELQLEIKHLQEMLSSHVPLLQLEGVSHLQDEEIISREQLNRLKATSAERELTLEETKKVETFTKIINQCMSRDLKDVTPEKSLSNEELLAQLNVATE